MKGKSARRAIFKDAPDSGNLMRTFVSTVAIVTCLKFLLIPAYYSTDLEVHRNWMAITYHRPLSQWYIEDTSQWTLDYPPFFAYLEWAMAHLARCFEPAMLTLSASPFMSAATLLFMRVSVIVTDLVYYYATYVWIHILNKNALLHSESGQTGHFWTSSPVFIQIVLFVFNIGHLMVDSVHFQYNGLLNGLFLLSMARMVSGQHHWAALWFSVLLNLKHIYLYAAPAYFLFLLLNVGLRTESQRIKINLGALFKLGLIVVSVFALSFGPFFWTGQMGHLLARLFPFQRGLSHAYWAPNVWALYNAADLVLSKLTGTKGSPNSNLTGGLVQQSDHQVLPSVTPTHTLLCVVCLLAVTSVLYARHRLGSGRTPSTASRQVEFVHLVVQSTLCFFAFGYHVHEKAILLVVPPSIPLIFTNLRYGRLFVLLSTLGYFSLFPLLFGPEQFLLQSILFAIHLLFTVVAIDQHYAHFKWNQSPSPFRPVLLNKCEWAYLCLLLPLHLLYWSSPLLPLLSHYPFLPLLLVSTYCSVGITYSLLRLFLSMPSI